MKTTIWGVLGLAVIGLSGTAFANNKGSLHVTTNLRTRVEQLVASQRGIHMEASSIRLSGTRGNPMGLKNFSGIGLTAPRLGHPFVQKYRVTGTVQRGIDGPAVVRNIRAKALPVIQNW